MNAGPGPVSFSAPAPPDASPPASFGGAVRRHVVWLLVSLSLLSVFPYYERVNNPNENVRIWMTRAIVDFHELQIGRVEREWGWVNDKVTVGGRLYSGKAAGASFLGVPIYAAGRAVARLARVGPLSKRAVTLLLRIFGVGVPISIFLYAFARWVERVTGSAYARDLLVAALGLGTLLYPYGVIFVGHALGAAAAFSGFMLLERAAPGAARRAHLVAAGALVGASVLFEYQIFFAVVPLVVYAIARHRRASLAFFAGAAPLALAFFAYQMAVFGHPFDLPWNHVENSGFARDFQGPLLGFRPPTLAVLGAVLFSPSLGLFVFSPFLLAGVAAALWLAARRRRAEGLTVLALSTVMVLFLSGVPNWHAGWCVGPRYVSIVAPFLTGALALSWRRHPTASWLVAGLAVPAVLLNVVSGAVYPHYPEVFDNPVFDLTLPLLRDGYQPYSLGWLVGLRGAWSLAPLALFVVAALAFGLVGPSPGARRRIAHAGAALAVAALVLVPLARFGRAPRAAETAAASFVRSTWEPSPVKPRAP